MSTGLLYFRPSYQDIVARDMETARDKLARGGCLLSPPHSVLPPLTPKQRSDVQLGHLLVCAANSFIDLDYNRKMCSTLIEEKLRKNIGTLMWHRWLSALPYVPSKPEKGTAQCRSGVCTLSFMFNANFPINSY